MNWTLFQNSLLVSAGATLLAVGLGLVAALWLSALPTFWRAVGLGAGALALALPPFLTTSCWLHLLGFTGVWRGWLPLNVYSLAGAAWVLALLFWPIPMLATWAAWQRLEAALVESEPELAGCRFIRWLLLPVARALLVEASVVTFVLALNNFAVPSILQVKVFPAEVYVRFSTSFDTAGALALSWPLFLAPLLLLAWLARRPITLPRVEGPLSARGWRRRLGPGWFWLSGLGTVATLGLAVGLPLGQLLLGPGTWQTLPGAIATGHDAIGMSLLFAAITATLTTGLGLWWWRAPVGLALWLFFLVPGVLLGIGLIWALNRPPLDVFYRGLGVVLLAFGIRYLVVGWQSARHARRTVDPELTDAGRLEGATGWTLFRQVHWPQMAPQLAAGWYLTYLLCLWDVETLVLIVPPGGETLALRVFNLLHYGHNVQVNALCLLLLVLAVLPVLLWGGLRLARWARRQPRWRGAAAGFLAAGTVFLGGCSPSGGDTVLHSRLFSRVEIIGTRGTGVGQFNKPRSVVVDRQGNLYVVDMTARVQKFSPTGAFLLSWQMYQTDLGKPKGMCLDAQGNVVVLEPHYSRINDFSLDGKLLRQWGKRGTNRGQFAFPRSVALNSHGEMYVSEYGVREIVQRFSPDYSQVLSLFGGGGAGPGQFNRAEGLGIDKEDRVYVADSCNHRIQVFSRQGQWLRSYGRPGVGKGELSYPYDVRVDAAGYQFVCEFGNSRIQVFDTHDQPVEILGGVGGAVGRFSSPYAIALDAAGDLYVADTLNHRVQKFVRRREAYAGDASPPRGARLGRGELTVVATEGMAGR